ncbi:MAG: trypsin-like peptidase domain-containing protein [Clostridia bacterium]|nr:trypsin-like peptidase domain-containing protein [Clostridia bacterium]
MQEENNQVPGTEQPIYCWNYGAQSAYDRGAKPRRRRGALTFAIIMTVAFLVSFGVLIGVLVRFADQPALPDAEVVPSVISERVVYVREYDSESGVLTVPEIAEKVKPSVVGVKVMSATGMGVGTGFVIREDGYIATNYHVVEGALSVIVILYDGSEHQAEIVGGDALTDLAVLKIKGLNYPAVEFGDSSALLVGELVVAIGTPSGLELAGTVTDGIVSAIDRNVKIYDQTGVLTKRMTLIQTNANINPGNSGGPLINDRGQVIGITTLKITGNYTTSYEGLGFALPINGAREILTSIIETGSAGDGSSFATGRPVLGIKGGNVTRGQGYPAEGILVSEITPGYPVEHSGLQVGDIIVELNGIRVYTTADVNAITEDLNGGDLVTLVVNRNGREVTLELELGWE